MNTFVRAHWSDLILLSYPVSGDLLSPFLGPFELDKWQGKAYVSVVGFHFGLTRILGVSPGPLLPNVSNFAQWNLRTYVRSHRGSGVTVGSDGSPGVVFIKEFVPSPMVTGLVRRVYRENYVTTSLSYKRVLDGDLTNARYDMDYEGRHHSIAAQTHLKPSLPDPESADYFFVERYWGSPGGNGERVIVFDIEHVPWGIYDVDSYSVDADFGVLYGEEWGFLNGCTPEYVTWCDGSSVGISWPVRT